MDELVFGKAKSDVEDIKEEDTELEETEVSNEEETEEEEVKEEVVKDSKTQALDAERARRKQIEREYKELKAKIEAQENAKKDEEELSRRKEELKKDLLKDDMIEEEIANKLVDTLGNKLLMSEIAGERKTEQEKFDSELNELKKNDMFLDVDVYKPQIKELMSKGLTMKQAYFASVGEDNFDRKMKDLEISIEQRLLNREEKAEKNDVGIPQSKSEVQKARYTKKEQDIARETGLDVKDVHRRMNAKTLDEILSLNKE